MQLAILFPRNPWRWETCTNTVPSPLRVQWKCPVSVGMIEMCAKASGHLGCHVSQVLSKICTQLVPEEDSLQQTCPPFFLSCAQMSSYKSTFQLVPFSNFITFVHFFACTVLKFYHTCPLFCLLCSQMSSYLSTFLFCSVLKFHNICPLFCLLRPQILSYLSTILFSLFSNVIILVHSSVCSVLKFHNTCPLFCLFRPRMSSYLSIFLFALFSIASYLFTFLFALFSNFIIPVHFSVCSVLKFHHICSLSCLLCSQIPSYIFIVLFVLLPDFIIEFQ